MERNSGPLLLIPLFTMTASRMAGTSNSISANTARLMPANCREERREAEKRDCSARE